MGAATLKHILVAVDFSETSDHARDYAIALAEQTGATVELLHVFEWPLYGGPVDIARGPGERLIEQLQGELDKALAAQGRAGEGRRVRVTTAMRKGIPHEAIVERARESSADLIVMGTRGHAGLKLVLLGSVAERVVRTSPIPVLTIGAAAAEELEEREPLQRADD